MFSEIKSLSTAVNANIFVPLYNKTQLPNLHNASIDQFLNFTHHHRIPHVLLCCLRVLLEICQYLQSIQWNYVRNGIYSQQSETIQISNRSLVKNNQDHLQKQEGTEAPTITNHRQCRPGDCNWGYTMGTEGHEG